MNSTDAIKILQEANGKHLQKIYIPSLQQYVFFYPLSTSHVKTLTRIDFIDKFDLSCQLLKLNLFDKLCTEDLSNKNINAHTITEIDYLSFLIGIRQLLKNDITFSFICKKCGKSFDKTIKLDEQFDAIIEKFRPQHHIFQKLDETTEKIWKFQLTNYSMESYLYYKFVLQELAAKSINGKNSVNLINQNRFLKPILYIKNIYLNDELIEDWPSLSFPSKLSFFNKISPNVTINQTKTNQTLFGFIRKTFYEEQIERHIKGMTVTCDGCNTTYKGVFELSNFFIFQGLLKTT